MSSNKKLLQAWKNLDMALRKNPADTFESGNEEDYVFDKPTRPFSGTSKPSRPQSSYILRTGGASQFESHKLLARWPSTTLVTSFASSKLSPNSQFRSTKGFLSTIFSPKAKYFDEETIIHSVSVKDLKQIYERKCVDAKNDFNPNQLSYFIDKFQKKCKKKLLDLEDQYIGPNAAYEIADLLVRNDHFVRVNLCKNTIGDYGAKCIAAALKENSTVVHLDLSNNAICHEGAAELFEALADNEYIVSLKLNNQAEGLNRNRIDSRGMRPLAQSLQQNQVLQFLDLSGSTITLEGMEFLAQGLEGNMSLASLNIADNDLGPKIQPLVKALLRCNLLELDLSNNKLGDAGLQALFLIFQQNTVNYSRLQSLNIGKNNITSFGITKLFDILSKNTTLKKLVLDENNLTGRGVSSIVSFLFENSTLNHLSLYNCQMNHEGADAIGTGVSRNFHIHTLILGKNPFKDEGIKLLVSGLKDNTSVSTIDLSGCKVRDEGGKLLAELIGTNHFLTKIDLKDNQMSDDAGLALVNAVRLNKRVSKLNIERNSTSYKYVTDIQKTIKANGSMMTKDSTVSFVKEMEYLKEFENQKYAVAQEGRLFDTKQKEVNEELNEQNEVFEQFRIEEQEKLEALEDEYANLLEENRKAERIRYEQDDKAQQLKADMESELQFIVFQTQQEFQEAEEFSRKVKKEKEGLDQVKMNYERQIGKLKVEIGDRERILNVLESTVNTTENQINRIREEKEKAKTPRSPMKADTRKDKSPSKKNAGFSGELEKSPTLKIRTLGRASTSKTNVGGSKVAGTLENTDAILMGGNDPESTKKVARKTSPKTKTIKISKGNPKTGKSK